MMNSLPPARIQLNRRGLTQILVFGLLLLLGTGGGGWYWQTGGGSVPWLARAEALAQGDPVVVQILVHPGIWSAGGILTYVLLMALLLRVIPPSWWLHTGRMTMAGAPEVMDTPLRWLGGKIRDAQEQLQSATGQRAADGTMPNVIYVQQPGATGVLDLNLPPGAAPQAAGPQIIIQQMPGQQVPNQLLNPQAPAPQAAGPQVIIQQMPGQPGAVPPVPGQPDPNQQPPAQPGPAPQMPGAPAPGAPVPGQPIAGQEPAQMQAPAQPPPNPTQPPLAVAIPPQPSLQDMLGDTQESNPLADIADIKDILTSAFDEDEGLDPDRAALGRSLDEVDIKELVRLTHQITDTLKQEPLDEPLLVQLEG